jgi:hypothetical protein
MPTIRWRCVSNNDPIAEAIKFVSRGEYSHIEFVFGGETIGARSDGGVLRRPLDHYHTETYFQADVTNEQYAVGMAFLTFQIGKGYDFLDIAATLLNRDWHNTDKWDCSELWYDSMTAFGLLKYLDPRICNRVTSQDGFLLSVAYFQKERE